jgi:hypothetical protein
MNVAAMAVRAQANGDPVPDRGKIRAVGGVMEKPARAFGGEFAVRREEFVGVLVNDCDSGRHQAGGNVGLEWIREGFIPTEGG